MKKTIVFLLIFVMFVLCGCDYREIDKGYLVTAIGFGSENGITTIFIEAMSSSDVSDKKSEKIVLTASGDNIEQAYRNLKNTLVKPLYFEQLGTAVFEDESPQNFDFLNQIPNINYGIYVVKTDDLKSLFENDTSSGVMGYDVIAFIKTQQKARRIDIAVKLYQSQKQNFTLPTVNFVDGNLILK